MDLKISDKMKTFLADLGDKDVSVGPGYQVEDEHKETLLDTVLGSSLSKTWLGITRQCNDAEKLVILKDELAEGADLRMLRISKQLINSKHKAYKALSRAASRVRSHWQSSTTAWVKPGVRILKKSNYNTFKEEHGKKIEAFEQARADFCAAWPDVVEDAKSRLNSLFEASLYPISLPLDTFTFSLEWPSLIGDSTVEALDPAQYAKMKAAAEARLDQACSLAEKAFAAQLQELVGRVVHALTPEVDAAGNSVKKKLGPSSLEAFKSFYTTFKSLKVADHEELDKLCQQALQMAEGVDLTNVKDCAEVAASVAQQFKGLADNIAVVTGVKQPVRKISKGSKKKAKTEEEVSTSS